MKIYIYNRKHGPSKLEYICKNKADLLDFMVYHGIGDGYRTTGIYSTIDDIIDEFNVNTSDRWASVYDFEYARM